VNATRHATVEELVALGRGRLDRMLLHGTTTVEAKSGYGLNRGDEFKQLEALRRLADAHPMTIVPTLPRGAHRPLGTARRSRRLRARGALENGAGGGATRAGPLLRRLRRPNAFTVGGSGHDPARRRRGRSRPAACTPTSAAPAAAPRWPPGCAPIRPITSTMSTRPASLRCGRSGTTAVPAAGASFFLRDPRDAPARALIDADVPVALATDFNPGTCPTEAMTTILAIACLRLGLLPSETVAAATLNAAHSLGLAGRIGSLEPGKEADLQVLDLPSHVHLAYRLGPNACRTVVKRGRVVVDDYRIVPR
jgi:imidazolonepropionase